MENYPKPISKHSTKIILEQMDKLFYIQSEEGDYPITGFFSLIKYKDQKIPVLIANRNIINKIINNKIDISLLGNNLQIKFGDIIYDCENYDISIFEIKENQIDENLYLDIDELLYKIDVEIYYSGESIYSIYYDDKEKQFVTSYGVINNILNSEIIFSCNINSNIKFAPIFNLSNNKIIGMFKNRSSYYHKGLIIKDIINGFIKKYRIKNNKYSKMVNEIEIIIDINNYNNNEKIYFLDNYEYKDKEGIYHLHDNLKQLNYSNTELYINKKQYKYKRYFRPEKNGEYHIKLKFKENLIDCSYMFAGCKYIKSINFFSFKTNSITNMTNMFRNCSKIEYLDLSSFDTKNVINMSNMFCGCYQLKNINISNFDTHNVTHMKGMFYECRNLTNLDLSSFNTKKVIDLSYMFYFCQGLKSIDLSSFDTRNVINMGNLFTGCENLITLNISRFITKNIKNIDKMFYNCQKLKSIDLSFFATDNIKNMENLFYGCENLTNLNLSNFNTKNVTDISKMFFGCKKLINLNITSFNTQNITDMTKLFYGCENLINLNLSSFDTKNVIKMNEMFYNCKKLNNLDLSSFSTKNVKDMGYMFYGCENLIKLNLSSFNTKNVKNMNSMFFNCKSLLRLNLSSFNTENSEDMSKLFYGCENLMELNLSSFDTKNVINMESMFYDCKKITELDLANFNAKNALNMDSMFYNCYNLKNINACSLNISKGVNMCKIFYKCENLTYLDLSSFEIYNFDDKNDIFFGYKYFTDYKKNNNKFFLNIEFINVLNTKNNENYIINAIKSIKYFDEVESIIKFKNNIIFYKKNIYYILNLANKPSEINCKMIVYDVKDKKSFKEIKDHLNNDKAINNNYLVYIIGINFDTKSKKNIPEIKELAEKHNYKHFSISSKDDNDIKNLLNNLFINISNDEMPYQINYKIILLGNSNIGKTNLYLRIRNNSFSENLPLTTGIDYFSETFFTKAGKKINLKFYDTAGQERYFSNVKLSIKGSDCAVLIYDITDKSSFDFIKDNWYKVIRSEFEEIKLIYLIGNKLDLEEENYCHFRGREVKREVSEEEAFQFSKENNLRYFEISCKENTNIKIFLDDLIEEISKIKKYYLLNSNYVKKKK